MVSKITTAGTVAPELLTTAEAAEMLHLGEQTLWRYSRSGVTPAPRKIGAPLGFQNANCRFGSKTDVLG
jgi:hypothetical protein